MQIAHNVVIGKNTVIAAQTGISGSAQMGERVKIGGQVGIMGHIEIGDNTAIGAQSGISKNISGGDGRLPRCSACGSKATNCLDSPARKTRRASESDRKEAGTVKAAS